LDDLKIEHEDSDVADVVTLSQGLASLIPKFGQQPETLVTMADQALYDAKEQGRNRTIVYENNGPPAAAQ
jgi:PleD family two-component response regulator